MDATLKNRLIYRLGTTSFIHPADYVTNVRRLAPFFDEIELLLFESLHLPSLKEIGQLADLSESNGITFNVHLPMDIDLAVRSEKTRHQSITAVKKAINRVTPLSPTTYTLHISFNRADGKGDTLETWQQRAIQSMSQLLDTVSINPGEISIETLDFPPLWLVPIVEALDLAVCVDIGHIMLYGFDLKQTLDRFAERITVLHLHGVDNGRDHRSIRQIEPRFRKTLSHFLRRYDQSVSIEVFSLKQLTDSMVCFPELMNCASTGES